MEKAKTVIFSEAFVLFDMKMLSKLTLLEIIESSHLSKGHLSVFYRTLKLIGPFYYILFAAL